MVVVVIIGVLTVLAVTGYRKYALSARNSEAVSFLGSVHAAQASYFQAFGQYCGTLNAARHPAQVPTTNKLDWAPVPAGPWRDLGIKSPGRVWFQYVLVAGTAAQPPPGDAPFLNGQVNNRAWYWVRANGDFNMNGTLSTFEISSVKPEVWINRENE